MDLADTDLEMANDPFLEAGISIPKKLPLQPLGNSSKWNVIRNMIMMRQKNAFSSVEKGDFSDFSKDGREYDQKILDKVIEMSNEQELQKNCNIYNPNEDDDEYNDEDHFDSDTRGAN